IIEHRIRREGSVLRQVAQRTNTARDYGSGMLVGRESECARLDELLDQARRGTCGALVIRGEAGIGKTALLDYAATSVPDMTVVRALGVESEAQLEFSGLL